ncbi:TatD family hydrolase [Cytophagales bacterium LB-30]|uniref:TatD family hydrolase n=1 Tax=Shiella aurantiaca TaxID=3058365 RepID=A0ABT8F6E1_9BACT|nr:TatD family hydrolase [Shiella aurantiaca]MDN4165839.1 TatD family hydrolase [Shiella aurantiaca]
MKASSFPLLNIHTHHLSSSPSGIELFNVLWGKESPPRNSYYSLGIHPWYLPQSLDQAMKSLREECQNPFCLAIGEAGLDRLCASPWDAQQRAFRLQVQMAAELGHPLIIHSVRAGEELIKILQEEKFTGTAIMHGFNQKLSLGQRYLDAGLILSFGAALLRADSNATAMLKTLGPKQVFFLETDDSTVSIESVYHATCAHLGVSMETLTTTIFNHFTTLFSRYESN